MITFSSDSTLRIPLTENDTSEFKRKVDEIPYGNGSVNILSALEEAYTEIQNHPVHPSVLVCK